MTTILAEKIQQELLSTHLISEDNLKDICAQIADIVLHASHSPQTNAKNILSVDLHKEDVIFIDNMKALTGIAGIIGSLGTLVVSPNMLSAIALIGALGALIGIKVALPKEQAIICQKLIESKTKKIKKELLKKAFIKMARKIPDLMIDPEDFENALRELRNLNCIEVRENVVILKETIIIRK
jgi:hypothetical protein